MRGNTMYFHRIEELRIDHDKTQQEIADLLHCQREVYRRYEKGTREIPVWAVICLAQYYQCSTDYLLGLSDKKTGGPVHRIARPAAPQEIRKDTLEKCTINPKE